MIGGWSRAEQGPCRAARRSAVQRISAVQSSASGIDCYARTVCLGYMRRPAHMPVLALRCVDWPLSTDDTICAHLPLPQKQQQKQQQQQQLELTSYVCFSSRTPADLRPCRTLTPCL
jgi:hypothetical protein